MSQNRWSAIEEYLQYLPEGTRPDDGVPDVDTYRVVVATDWSSITLPLTVLKAYATMIPAGAPVTLVMAVPHTPGPRDTHAVRILREQLPVPLRAASISVESFGDVAVRPALVAFVPGGDEHVLLQELGDGMVHLHVLATVVADPEALRAAPPPRRGHMRGLAQRLDQYRGMSAP